VFVRVRQTVIENRSKVKCVSASGTDPSRISETIRAGLFLLLLTLVGLAACTPWFGLVGDDWWFFAHLTDGRFPAAQFYENPARPMVAYLWLGLWQLLGLRIWGYYIFTFVVQWLTALMVFVMFRNIFRWSVMDAVTVAAFFLLYPADTAHAYLSTLSTRTCMLLAITGSLLWLRTWMGSVRIVLVLGTSLILMTLSLLSYETPLFLFALLPLVLAGTAWRGFRIWLLHAISCYVVLALYLVFRLGVAYVVSQRSIHFYVSIKLTPDWLCSQIRALPAATIWNGWLYALKAILDFGLMEAVVILILLMAVLLLAFKWLLRETRSAFRDWRKNLVLIGVGFCLSAVAVAPIVVSSFSLENAVGTLNGRFVLGAALGHAVLITGAIALPGSILPLSGKGRTLLREMLVVLLLAIALLGGLGVQRQYAQAWRAQLDTVRALQNYSVTFDDDTVLLLLDVPTGAFDIRFYYPFTQLVRRFYANPTLHVLPWQEGFSPDRQLLAFGEEQIVAVTDVVRKDTVHFDYDHVVAFQVEPDGGLRPVQVIDSHYLCGDTCADVVFALPEGWEPARVPIILRDTDSHVTTGAPSYTAWYRLFLSQLDFADRFELP